MTALGHREAKATTVSRDEREGLQHLASYHRNTKTLSPVNFIRTATPEWTWFLTSIGLSQLRQGNAAREENQARLKSTSTMDPHQYRSNGQEGCPRWRIQGWIKSSVSSVFPSVRGPKRAGMFFLNNSQRKAAKFCLFFGFEMNFFRK